MPLTIKEPTAAPKQLLTKCVYGYETDSKKTPFNFLNNQTRLNGIINSAGWFNIKGAKLGNGDLTLKDMQKIAKSLPTGEVFFALSELSSSWDIPSELDRTEPGYDYVMQNAAWIISSGKILRVCNEDIKIEECLRDTVKYTKLSRKELFAAVKYSKPAVDKKKLQDTMDTAKDKLKQILTTKLQANKTSQTSGTVMKSVAAPVSTQPALNIIPKKAPLTVKRSVPTSPSAPKKLFKPGTKSP